MLRTALAHTGLKILEAARANEGLALAKLHHPKVIVIDLETVDDAAQSTGDFAAAAKNSGGKVIVLGAAGHNRDVTPCEFFAKPYHYKPLVLRIEELLHAERGHAAA